MNEVNSDTNRGPQSDFQSEGRVSFLKNFNRRNEMLALGAKHFAETQAPTYYVSENQIIGPAKYLTSVQKYYLYNTRQSRNRCGTCFTGFF